MLVIGVLFEPFGSSEKCSIIVSWLYHEALVLSFVVVGLD